MSKTKKRKTQKHSRQETNDAYEHFFSIYNQDKHKISGIFSMRIMNKHYKYITINKLLNALIWFEDKYGADNYSISLSYNDILTKGTGKPLRLGIYDNENNRFATYIFYKDKKYFVSELLHEDFNYYSNLLKEQKLYDSEKHFIFNESSVLDFNAKLSHKELMKLDQLYLESIE